MFRRIFWGIVLAIASTAPDPRHATAEEPADDTAIRAAISSYADAFNRGDAAAVASHWSADGEFRTPAGKVLHGRAAIEQEFTEYFQETQGAKVEVDAPKIRMLSPGVAVEEGTARVLRPEEEPLESSYVAVHVKTSDGWKMDSVRERERIVPSSHYEQLKDLAWMIGAWTDEAGEDAVETVCQWTKNRNFITRSFRVRIEGRVELEGTQVIGWDADAQCIRSWVFDSEGGFGVGAWSRDGDRWTIRTLQILADGSRASSINILTRIDDDTCTFRSVGREVDGTLLPNIDEITVVRK